MQRDEICSKQYVWVENFTSEGKNYTYSTVLYVFNFNPQQSATMTLTWPGLDSNIS